jgi:hypothetical protein
MEGGGWRVMGIGDGGWQISDFNIFFARRRVASRHFDMENDHTIDTPR